MLLRLSRHVGGIEQGVDWLSDGRLPIPLCVARANLVYLSSRNLLCVFCLFVQGEDHAMLGIVFAIGIRIRHITARPFLPVRCPSELPEPELPFLCEKKHRFLIFDSGPAFRSPKGYFSDLGDAIGRGVTEESPMWGCSGYSWPHGTRPASS